jgi:secreted trypsin-like serine protease
MSFPFRKPWLFAPLALAATLATLPAQAQDGRFGGPSLVVPGSITPQTGNTSPVANWRLTAGSTFNGVQGAFDATALLLFQSANLSGTYACSGSLMKGGEYVLTAAHCAEDLISMTVQFGYTNGVALETRTVTEAIVHPGWNGTLDSGADIALVKLDTKVTTLQGYSLSTTNDIGKNYIMTGYGTSGTGYGVTGPNWNDSAYGHFGYNTFDVESSDFTSAWDAYSGEGVYTAPTYGVTYVSDFDSYNLSDPARYNTLDRIAALTGGSWTSSAGLGADEALIAGGDSGGGDFVWNGSEWVLSAVHSWGWQFCGGRVSPSCDYRSNNGSSYGDLSGSTAVFSHVDWINATINPVPEPGTYAMALLGLAVVGGAARRRRG